jgi:hypothetical protein
MLTFTSLIQSKPFTFYVGEEEKPIVVHAAVIAATSQYFDALINGGMRESEEGSAKLADVQFDDFLRFCAYAYCGDYEGPTIGAAEKGPDDGSSLLLTHARLYCFASIRFIEPLRELALENLKGGLWGVPDLLCGDSEFSSGIEGYLKLVKYVYSDASNLPGRASSGQVDELKQLVTKDVVKNLCVLHDTDEFNSLLEEGGEFVSDFWASLKAKLYLNGEHAFWWDT